MNIARDLLFLSLIFKPVRRNLIHMFRICLHRSHQNSVRQKHLKSKNTPVFFVPGLWSLNEEVVLCQMPRGRSHRHAVLPAHLTLLLPSAPSQGVRWEAAWINLGNPSKAGKSSWKSWSTQKGGERPVTQNSGAWLSGH